MMSQRVGAILFLILLAVAGGGSLFYTFYRLQTHDKMEAARHSESENQESAQGNTITLTETKNGSRKWVLKMKEIEYSKDNSVASLTGVEGLVYGDREKVLFTFKSPKGRYYKEKSQVELNDGAKMRFPEADVVMFAPHMDWSSETGIVHASGGVEMAKKNFGLTRARQAVFAMDFSHVRFEGNANSILGGHSNIGE